MLSAERRRARRSCFRSRSIPTASSEAAGKSFVLPPFCISCAHVVDNPAAPSTRIFPRRFVDTKLPPSNEKTASCQAIFQMFQFGKSASTLFLNCTKNTELTRAHFTLTVTFALIKIS